jgi:hypothetical protein
MDKGGLLHTGARPGKHNSPPSAGTRFEPDQGRAIPEEYDEGPRGS